MNAINTEQVLWTAVRLLLREKLGINNTCKDYFWYTKCFPHTMMHADNILNDNMLDLFDVIWKVRLC